MNAALVMQEDIEDEPLFTTALAAVRFAVTRDGRFGRPLFAKLIVSEGQSLRALGLTPYDAAAQAGFILSIIRQLKRLQFATVIAKSAPQTISCTCHRPCCSGRKLSVEWQQSINELVASAGALFPGLTWRVREALIVKIYGHSQPLPVLAKQLSVELDDLVQWHRGLTRWLLGSRARGGVAVEGVEPAAWREAETLLRNAGVVGG